MIANVVFMPLLFIFFENVNSQVREKRLLLTDPAEIYTHITELQHDLQELTSKFQARAAVVQSQQSELLHRKLL